jgi:hypothetical protein
MDIMMEAAQMDLMNERNIVKRWKTMVGKAVFCQQMFLIEWCLAKTYMGGVLPANVLEVVQLYVVGPAFGYAHSNFN